MLSTKKQLTKPHFQLLLTSRLKTLKLDWLVDWPLKEKDDMEIAEVLHLISLRCPVKNLNIFLHHSLNFAIQQ